MTDSELTDTTVSSNDEEYFAAMSEEEFGEDGNLQTAFEPYQDEPLASSSDEDEDNGVAEADIDGIPLETLQARFEKRQAVEEW